MKTVKNLLAIPLALLILFCIFVGCNSSDRDKSINSNVLSNGDFVDEITFEVIRDAYARLDFSGEFKKQNTDLDNDYKEQFYKLLKCNKTFWNKKMKNEYYVNEFGEMKYEYSPNDYVYYFFDMDSDGTPELSISDGTRFIYIMKYCRDIDKIVLWHEIDTTCINFMGSGKLWFYGGSSPLIEYAFFELDENGEEECTVNFYIEVHPDTDEKEYNETYMVALPKYADNTETSENMKQQGKKKEPTDDYYFRVTKPQWEELTGDFFHAKDLSIDNLENFSFTFKELFG